LEGTWPNTSSWLRDALRGVPEEEVRLILGENAISCFRLDRGKLADIAERIGPRPQDLLGSGHVVDPRLIEQFDKRGGYCRPAESVDLKALEEAFAEDLAGVA
jgi:hypothetical protein